MILLDEQKAKIKTLTATYQSCCEAFDLDKLKARREELTKLQEDPELYKDLARAQSINIEAKSIDDKFGTIDSLAKRLTDASEMIELIEMEDDGSYVSELDRTLDELEKDIEIVNLSTMLRGEYDKCNAILTLHAGAGGTEAMDWTQMLYRMYSMYADKAGFTLSELDYLAGDEAGIKSVTFMMKGENAYGFLKAEKGVHRLVRISPFDSQARRHTSFASLEVMPEIEHDNSITVKQEDLRVDTYRSSGAGGQHINKTDSAIRITHLPTGIVVQCQNERSQIQNRETAMKMLIGKLVELRERENQEKANAIKGEIKKIEWGSQIRSYVFQPYTMVKDHRTGYEDTDIDSVMNGNIEQFIYDYLRKTS